jgi:hypothetical protein
MATTPAQITNLALGAIGQRQLIDLLTEDSPEAAAAQVYYEQARLEVLSSWWWKFATKRQVLALTGDERTDWAFCYATPSDCLVARYIWNGRAAPTNIPFDKELDDAGTGLVILTDQEDAELVYTAKAPPIGLYPPHFVRAFALHLATYLANMLPVRPELGNNLNQRATFALQTAQKLDANEGKQDEKPDSEFTRVR